MGAYRADMEADEAAEAGRSLRYAQVVAAFISFSGPVTLHRPKLAAGKLRF
jgi:hypothetical protein